MAYAWGAPGTGVAKLTERAAPGRAPVGEALLRAPAPAMTGAGA